MSLASDRRLAASVEIICLDNDPNALQQARQALGPVFGSRTQFRRAETEQWLFDPDCKPASAAIVFASSLFDTRDAPAVVRILRGAYQSLHDGGVLLAGCGTPNVPVGERVLRDLLLGITIRGRDEQQWRGLLEQTTFGSQRVRFAYEPLHINMVLSVPRPGEERSSSRGD